MSENSTPGQPEASVETASPAQGGQPSTADLVDLVGDKSDEAIVTMINEHGADTFLGGIFDEMGKRFLPEKAAGRTAVIGAVCVGWSWTALAWLASSYAVRMFAITAGFWRSGG